MPATSIQCHPQSTGRPRLVIFEAQKKLVLSTVKPTTWPGAAPIGDVGRDMAPPWVWSIGRRWCPPVPSHWPQPFAFALPHAAGSQLFLRLVPAGPPPIPDSLVRLALSASAAGYVSFASTGASGSIAA